MIDVQLTRKLGLIGYRNHAKKLLDIVDNDKHFEITHIYHPTKKIDDPKEIMGINTIKQLESFEE